MATWSDESGSDGTWTEGPLPTWGQTGLWWGLANLFWGIGINYFGGSWSDESTSDGAWSD